MPYYKDKNNGIHFLEGSEFESCLPDGCTPITDSDAAVLLTPSLPDVKADMWTKIKAERDNRWQGGVKVNLGGADKWFCTDPGSKIQQLGNKDTIRDQIAAGGSMGDFLVCEDTGVSFQWKTMDGSAVQLTGQNVFDIVKAIKLHDLEVFQVAETHKASMEASSTPASYDFSAGWPKNYGE